MTMIKVECPLSENVPWLKVLGDVNVPVLLLTYTKLLGKISLIFNQFATPDP